MANYPDGLVNAHLLILYGSNDGGLTCWKDRAWKIKKGQYAQIFKIYEGAHHLFDFPNATNKKCRTIRGRPSYELCLLYDEEAHQKSIADLKAFLMKYAR
jgi:dienelactone hydrolase